MNAENVLESKRLKIELIGRIIVGRNGFWVAVYDNGLESKLLECKGCMNAAVIEFDTLSDSVRTAAENHDLRLVSINGTLVLVKMICGVIVSSVFGSAYVNALPCFLDAEADTSVSYFFFCNFKERAEVTVAETVELSLFKNVLFRNRAFHCNKLLFLLNKLRHLLQEPALDLGKLEYFVNSCALSESLINDELSFA